MSDEFCAFLVRKLHEDGLEHSRAIVQGTPEDWASYQREVGYLAGLTQAVDIAREALKHFADDPEEAQETHE